MENGILISNKEYREREGVSSSDLKRMAKSPAHFRYYKDNPQEDTPALLFGRACHKYMLEKDAFFDEFAIAPEINRRTKQGKEDWAYFQEQNKGKDLIAPSDFKKIQEMHKALAATPFAEQLLQGEKERSYFTKDKSTGLIIKCRPDCRTKIGDTSILIDYKTCADASSDGFVRDAIKLMYDLQMAFYKDIMDEITGENHAVIFIAQEKTAPYCVNILEANEFFLKSGRDMYRTYLDIYKECQDSENWYGYTNGEINSLGLPGWLQKQYE